MNERVALVPSLVNVTLAPLIGAPEASAIVPRMVPVSTWARRGCALKNRISNAAVIAKEAFRIPDEMALRFIMRSSSVSLHQNPASCASAFISADSLKRCKGTTSLLPQLSAKSFCGSCPTERQLELAKQNSVRFTAPTLVLVNARGTERTKLQS